MQLLQVTFERLGNKVVERRNDHRALLSRESQCGLDRGHYRRPWDLWQEIAEEVGLSFFLVSGHRRIVGP